MLAERITSVAPQMPSDIRRWLLEQDYAKPSVEHQDWDLILADWDYVPLLIEYIEDPASPSDKRHAAFSAPLVLQGDAGDSEAERRNSLTHQIRRIVIEHPDFAREVSIEWLGLVEALTVKAMMGEDIPEDVPQWVREEVKRRA